MDAAAGYPCDILAYTKQELEAELDAGNPFLAGILRDSLQLHP
jgi:hypothetical protein